MKKRYTYLILGLFILITGVLITSMGVDKTKAYHNSMNVSIGIDSVSQTITAIASLHFAFPSHTYSSVLSLNPGHNADQIWVSVKDGEMSLSAALSSANKLCPASPVKPSYASSPTDKSQPYHYATEIQLPYEKNLQETIDAGDFCYSWYVNSSSCSLLCGGGTSATYCVLNGTKQVPDNYCYGTKPSVSCNTQTCAWKLVGRGQLPGNACMGCACNLPSTCTSGQTYMCCCSSGNFASSLRFLCT